MSTPCKKGEGAGQCQQRVKRSGTVGRGSGTVSTPCKKERRSGTVSATCKKERSGTV